jgi:integrase
MWGRHLKPRCSHLRLRDFRTYHGQQLLINIARTNALSRASMMHLKSLMSGIFKHAKRQGLLDGINPMQDVGVPKTKPIGETHAYSLEQVVRMLAVLSDVAAAIVAMAAFTGARRGEIRGFRWENYDGMSIRVMQSVWRSHMTDPKTPKSKSPVPVIPQLAAVLNRYKHAQGNPSEGVMFKSQTGTPLDLADLARRVVRPALQVAGLPWYGWHAFRRGLATNLYRLGVPDKTIQAILRHSNLSTTMNCYVKSVPADAQAAMDALAAECTQYAPEDEQQDAGDAPVVM